MFELIMMILPLRMTFAHTPMIRLWPQRQVDLASGTRPRPHH
jgi:hypothetical protein